MANHSRTKRKTHRSTQSATFPWTWLLSGMCVGILGTAVLFALFHDRSPINLTLTKRPTLKKTQAKKKKLIAKTTQKRPAQRFEFYHLLPGMEVPVAKEATKSTVKQKPPKTTIKRVTVKSERPKSTMPNVKKSHKIITKSKPQKTVVKVQKRIAAAQYLIQVGTYQDSKEATALKKHLSAKHFSPRIRKVETENGTRFRVTLGPFPTEASALQKKRRLEKQNIQSILILQR